MSTSATPVTKSQGIVPLTQSKAWNALESHYQQVNALHLRDLFVTFFYAFGRLVIRFFLQRTPQSSNQID